MLLSLALILLCGVALGAIFKKLRLPSLIGYMALGALLAAFSLIDEGILSISSQICQIALILILLRSGLSLSLSDLKKVGRPALLMCFLPATLEICAVGFLVPLLFGISYGESFLMGSVLGAVSPAVVSPRMIEMIEKKQGTREGVPQLILAGASADDVYAVVAFTAFSSLAVGQSVSFFTFANVPLSVVLGVLSGILLGFALVWLFKGKMRGIVKAIVTLAVCFAAVALENFLKEISCPVSYSGLLACMTIGMVVFEKDKGEGKALSATYNKMWVVAEIFLFVLVGASVNLSFFLSCLPKALALLACGLLLRMGGVFLCCVRTGLNGKERLFCALAYTPKATVQAALIGAIPSALALSTQNIIVSVAVVAIVVTAPVGAFVIDFTKDKLVRQKT